MVPEGSGILRLQAQSRLQKLSESLFELKGEIGSTLLKRVPKREMSGVHYLDRRSDNIVPARPISEKLDCPIKAFELLGLLHLVLRKQTVRPV